MTFEEMLAAISVRDGSVGLALDAAYEDKLEGFEGQVVTDLANNVEAETDTATMLRQTREVLDGMVSDLMATVGKVSALLEEEIDRRR